MSISKKIDLAIKLSETGTADGGYVVGESTYPTYMSNEEWESFKAGMTSDVISEYGEGSGAELDEKKERPPKMACYGSSSRMIYMLSRHKDGFHYEKKLPTTVGGIANLDGFMEENNRYVFVEAKCHEPYSAKSSSVSKAYEKLYTYINTHMGGNVKIKMKISKCGRYLDVEYYSDGEKLEYFDMKQMICHLLGIATGVLKGELKQKQIDFIYLLYDPTELDIDTGAKEKIDSIYERTRYECNIVDFAALLRTIFEFLKTEKSLVTISDEELDALACKFTFSLVSQEIYKELLQ